MSAGVNSMPIFHRLIIIAAAVALYTPVAMFTFGGTDLPLSDLVCVVGVILSLNYVGLAFTRLLYLAIVLSIFAGLAIALSVKQDLDERTVFSIIYFYKPYFSIFVAFALVRNKAESAEFFRASVAIIFIVIAAIFTWILIFHSGLVRNDGDLNGAVFGLPLYGSAGVNSLAVYYLLLYFVVLYAKFIYPRLTRTQSVLRMLSLIMLSYMIMMSLSREAIVGFAALLGWYVYAVKQGVIQKVLITVVIVCGIGYALTFDATQEMLASKTTQIVEGIEEGDLDKISSGRLTLQSIALLQFSNNVAFGNGFHGFQLYDQTITGYDSIEGLSPHNQYVTTLWKMGAIAALPYLLALCCLWRMMGAGRGSIHFIFFRALLIVVFVILANLWDVLIIPNFGALLFFIWGVMISSSLQAAGVRK